MKSAIYVEETLIECPSPTGRYNTFFEDDTKTAYFYALDMEKVDLPIVESLHIYNVDSIVDKDIPSNVQIVWSSDGKKSKLMINNYPHAIINFETKRGYYRNGFPPPNSEWTQFGNDWDDNALELFD
jgi:hypothetical protein